MHDDESAYYSEIGTFRNRGEREESDIHYASRTVFDRNFYHVVEEPEVGPPVPPNPPIPFHYHTPPYPVPTPESATYKINNNR